jgi:hypothetical protein
MDLGVDVDAGLGREAQLIGAQGVVVGRQDQERRSGDGSGRLGRGRLGGVVAHAISVARWAPHDRRIVRTNAPTSGAARDRYRLSAAHQTTAMGCPAVAVARSVLLTLNGPVDVDAFVAS